MRIPAIEMVEIGAGGGSIAHVDRMGRLQVGPETGSGLLNGRGRPRPTETY
ncbi:MAG: hydantoinase/oxoprolinase family protein [Thalassobaculum sp.]